MEIGIGMYDIILTAQSHVEDQGSESGKIRKSIFEKVRTNRDGNVRKTKDVFCNIQQKNVFCCQVEGGVK